ncbi:hypothetical protein [Maridesulfovibrio sp.]|uniref:hypothetical protein n=1 Tax=Maridesulfovibrio sp. TaxID=2795000 RepID=UPI0029CA6675|nr:hypothetical protein [Maridesulfovibrio sp.]
MSEYIKFDAGRNKTGFLKKEQVKMIEELAARCPKIGPKELMQSHYNQFGQKQHEGMKE